MDQDGEGEEVRPLSHRTLSLMARWPFQSETGLRRNMELHSISYPSKFTRPDVASTS